MSIRYEAHRIMVLQTPLVPSDCQLVLNISDQIITLLNNGSILAQHYFPRYQFRLLLLLLKLPGGALHAELLAMLDSSEKSLQAMLTTSGEKEVTMLMHRHIQRWQAHLSQISQDGPKAKRRELAVVRRSLTGKRGLNTLLHDFGMAVYPVYKQGYVLRPVDQGRREKDRNKVLAS